MKKNFFKKLSFVMALAMIVSIIAPAAGAFAATDDAHLNATKKYLHLGDSQYGVYDFNIAHKQAGWKYAWTSSDEDVATVDEANGLTTATGVGSAKISVAITDKDGADVATLDATVVVRDNIKAITEVYMQTKDAPALDKLQVATDYDFGRKFETVSGSTTVTSSVTRWFVDSDKATIAADTGVFKAAEAGTYKITAVAFQSKDKYNAWVALKDTTSTVNVLDSKTVEVKVVNDVKSVEQINATTAKLTFAAPKKDASAADLKVSLLVANTKIYQTIKKVTPSEDGLTATVEMYASFNAGTTYVFDYADMTSRQFVAASAKVTDVTRVEIATTQVEVQKVPAATVEVKLYNKDNVELTSIDPTLSTRVILSGTSSKVSFDAANKTVYFFTAGDTITVTATFHTYDFDSTTGTEKGVLTATGTIVGVPAAAAASISGISAWTIGGDFNNINHTVAAEDALTNLYVKLVKTDTNTVDSIATPGNFRFQSSDNTVLNVGTTGSLYAVKAGAANVIVTYSSVGFVNDAGTVIGAVPITVSAKRAATTLSLSSNNFTLSNSLVYAETKSVTITLKDQYGKDFPVSSVVVTAGATAPGAVIPFTGNTNAAINFAGAGRTVGAFAYTVTVNGISQLIVVNVAAPSAQSSSYYRLSTGASYDVKLTADNHYTVDAAVSVVGYSANGIAYETVTPGALAAAGLSITLTKPDGTSVAVTTGSINLANAVSGSAVFQAKTGTYTLKLTKTVNTFSQVVDQVVFTVSNSTSQPSYEVKTLVAPTAVTVQAALAECFTVKLDGTPVVVSVNADDYVAVLNSKDVFVKNVRFNVVINGAILEYVVPVSQMITLK